MTTQLVVQQGTRWQVGNGQSIDVCNDKWLNQPSTFRLTSRLVAVPDDEKLSLFIDPYTAAWRRDMIQQFFAPHDAKAILSIPLSLRLPRDRLVWAYTPEGTFLVKSTYKLARYLSANAIDS